MRKRLEKINKGNRTQSTDQRNQKAKIHTVRTLKGGITTDPITLRKPLVYIFKAYISLNWKIAKDEFLDAPKLN